MHVSCNTFSASITQHAVAFMPSIVKGYPVCAQVVVGVVDPNPLVGGQGIATLTSAGIDVAQVGGQEEGDCYAINADFMERMKAQAAG